MRKMAFLLQTMKTMKAKPETSFKKTILYRVPPASSRHLLETGKYTHVNE